MSVRARVDSKGRILIPKSLRELAGIREGEEVLVSVEGGRVVIEKAGDPWRELAELLGDLTFDRSLLRLAEDERRRRFARDKLSARSQPFG